MLLMSRVARLYEARGFQIRSSITPTLLGPGWNLHHDMDISITHILRNGKMASPAGGGIHMTEIHLMEDLGRVLPRRNILVIGNAFGWSTFALKLANPEARVVGVDAAGFALSKEGIELTNRIAREERLDVEAVLGRSPEDVPRIVAEHLRAPPDLCFIDADHKDESQTADFLACRRVSSPDCVFLFHDVVAFKMLGSFLQFPQVDPNLEARLLGRTYSGMGLLFPRARGSEIADLVHAYSDPALEIVEGRAEDGSIQRQLRMRLPMRARGGLVSPEEFFQQPDTPPGG